MSFWGIEIMHYGILAIVERPDEITKDTIESAVSSVMEPTRDQNWDWFMVGGRWTGSLDGFDPEIAYQEVCDLCGGTGDRATHRGEPKDHQHPSGCNGCLGKGTRTTWPTSWPFRLGDVLPVEQLTAEHVDKFYAVVVSGYGQWFGVERYEPWHDEITGRFIRTDKPPIEWLKKDHGSYLAVVVDCHN